MDGSPLADLDVYRFGARCVLDGVSPYLRSDPIHGYPFTYPPFAAVLMVPLALLPTAVAAALWTGLSVACLAGTIALVRRARGHDLTLWFVIVVSVASLALEPIWQNVWFGQINLILMLAILADVVRPDRRTAGVLIGIAAGIKLTPLVFVVLLILIGRHAAATRATLTFGATLLVGWVAVPGGSVYWGERLLDPTRVGPPSLAHNQSISGALTRVLEGPPPTWMWLVVAGPIALLTVWVAAAWWRRGDRALGAGLAALAMLIASPVSWSHHWVWAVPLGLAVWERSRVAAVLWAAVFVTRPMLWLPWGEKREYVWPWYDHVPGNAYLLAALTLTAWLGWRLYRPNVSQLPVP
jgi:alpha-1,2-mannosyltransferase